MKKFLVLIISLLFSSYGVAQNLNPDSFPEFYRQDSVILGVVFSIPQAQKIDRDQEMLSLLKTLNSQYEENRISSLNIINLQNTTIREKDLIIGKLEDNLKEHKIQISRKDSLIDAKNEEVSTEKQEKAIHLKTIETKNEEIKKLKNHRIILFTIVVLLGIFG